MLDRKRIVCLLLPFVFISPSTLTPFPKAKQLIDSKINSNEMVLETNELGLLEHPFITKSKKIKEDNDKKKLEEETLRKQKELEVQKKNEPQWQEYILTFYSSMNSENGYGAITSQGKRLSRGGVANNVIPQNTKLYLEKWGEVIVNDKGSNKHFSVDNRLDVYIEREAGESDSQYKKRVNSYGIQRVKGYIVKENN